MATTTTNFNRWKVSSVNTTPSFSNYSTCFFSDIAVDHSQHLTKMAYWGQLTAVEKVPIELWDEIFKLAEAKEDPDGPSTTNDTINRYIRPPVTFSQVSTKWRKIALSFPHLWTHISLEITNEGTVDHFPGPYLSQTFFERSPGLPLSVELAMHGLIVSTKRQCDAFDFIRHLFRNFQRWRTASISLTFKNIDRIIWGALEAGVKGQGSTLMLESLDLRLGPQSLVDQKKGTIMFPSFLWESAPTLKRLSISIDDVILPKGMDSAMNIVVAPRWGLRTRIPYGQLTHLLLDSGHDADMTWVEIHTIFSLAPALVCAFFMGIKPHLWDQKRKKPPAGPVLLRSLRNLYIQTHGDPLDAEIGCKLDIRLIAPRLKTLAFVDWIIDWWQSDYTAFITQSQCELEELYLAMPHNSVKLTDFVECMRLSPRLKLVHLDLCEYGRWDDDTDFPARLAGWDGEATPRGRFRICPDLQTISLRNIHGPLTEFMPEDATNGFSEMLKTRSRPPDGSTGNFKTLGLPSNVLGDEGVMAGLNLNVLRENPWRLEIVENNTIVDAMKLWRRYCSDA